MLERVQALFVRKSTFEAIGGFKDMPIMEDVEIQVRLRRMGRFTKICEPATTSARRFLQCGIIRQQVLNTILVGLYYAGVPPQPLRNSVPTPSMEDMRTGKLVRN